ncbi:DUF1189 domain-containing protein [Bacillus sp. 1P06AnD]|uniref:DUF1189 domain-containing protein n=1 Tax=Bacillus sp. 1P06AnD TaxID=3132208 RepID=UPI0039A3C3AF
MKKNVPFPLNYARNSVSPQRMFKGRKEMGWGKLLLLFVFLNACMILPTSLHFTKAKSFDLFDVMPETIGMINQKTVEMMQKHPIIDGTMGGRIVEQPIAGPEGIILFSLDQPAQTKAENAIIFSRKEMILKNEKGYDFTVRYKNNESDADVENTDQLKAWLNDQWYTQNKAFLYLTMVLMVGSILVGSTTMLALVAALFLWLAKKSRMTAIETFKEGFHMTIYSLGLPTLVSMCAGILHYDVTLMIAIQSLGMVLMIAFIFFKTTFVQEERRTEANSRGKKA